MESAFNIYNEEKEFESSCLCALYLSLMHRAIGNTNEELHSSWAAREILDKKMLSLTSEAEFIREHFMQEGH